MSDQHPTQSPYNDLRELYCALSRDPDRVRTVGMAEELELAKRGLDSGQEGRIWVLLLLLVFLAHSRGLESLPVISTAYTIAKQTLQQRADVTLSLTQREDFREKYHV